MPRSPVPSGKRPEFKQSASTGWTWPRLVPVHEHQSRVPQGKQSSASPSLRGHNEQEEPSPALIATIISKLHAEEDAPPSPVSSAAGRSPTAGGFVAGTVNHEPYEHIRSSLSSMVDSDNEERRAASSTPNSDEETAKKNSPDLERRSVRDAAEQNIPGSERASVHDVNGKNPLGSDRGFAWYAAETNSPGSEHRPAHDVTEKDSTGPERESVQDAAETNSPGSEHRPAHDVTEKDSTGPEREFVQDAAETNPWSSGSGSVQDAAEKDAQGSIFGPYQDIGEMSVSASEHGPVKDIARQDDIEIPVAYESTITDIPLEEETPATPAATPIPPVMDRVSVPSTSVPYYATPKIMVQRPSQSSEEENPASRTIDEILANERQSVPEGGNSRLPHPTPDGNLIDEPPMQSLSLRPIAWQAPKDQNVRKRSLYLRKLRNAAARKTILKATLGRQLAVPTKQMLRLLADGENLTIPEPLKPGVEAATMLVPQEAVGSVTGAVLLPQGLEGAVPDE